MTAVRPDMYRSAQTNDRLIDNLESLLLNLSGRDLSNPQLDRMARILYWRGERMVVDEAGKREWDGEVA
jgi:hypothetical protein